MKSQLKPLILAAMCTLLAAANALAAQPPVAYDQTASTAEDTAKTITLSATDGDGDALSYAVVDSPAHGTLTGTAPELTYQPAADYSGPDSFTFKANDGVADSNIASVNITVIADTTPPTGSILINDGAASTTSPEVTLSLSASDAGGSGLASMHFRNSTLDPYSDWEPYQATKQWTLKSGTGTKRVYAQFMDGSGNVSDANAVTTGAQGYSDEIAVYDTTPPTGSILINDGAASTTSPEVTLSLSASDAGGSGLASMHFRNSTMDPYSDWEPYQATKQWTLKSGTGTKRVYAQFMDGSGNVSDANAVTTGAQGYSDEIAVYDTTPPTGSILINDGAASTTTPEVTLSLSASDTGGSGLASMHFRNSTLDPYSEWEPYRATKQWTLRSGTGTKRVYAQYMDGSGNVSDANAVTTGAQGYSDEIVVYDKTPPTGSILINGGDAATRSTAATLALTATDDGGGAIQMCVSNTTTCSDWIAFAATRSWTLDAGDGTKTVNVWFQDQWGNASATPSSDTIVMDTTEPTNGTVTVIFGVARQLTVSWSGFADTAGSGITGYRAVFLVGSAPASCVSGTQVPGYAGTATTLVHSGLVNGTTYGYRVCAIDAAGNVSSGATASSQVVSISCEECHNGNSAYPLAPNVMGNGTNPTGVGTTPKPYDDGTWGYNVNGHGANGTAPNTPRDSMGYPGLAGDATCTNCHDIGNPAGTHLDGVLNSVELKQNPNANTAHLTAPYIGSSSPEWSVQLTFDNRCSIQCHPSSIRHRHSLDALPAAGAVRFGDKGVNPYDGEGIAYPIDSALSTKASTAEPDFAPCIACHNPHGTSVVEEGRVSNSMVRANWIAQDILCSIVCHNVEPVPASAPAPGR